MEDLENLSNEQLMQIAGIKNNSGSERDLNSLSNEELMKIAGVEPKTSTLEKVGQFAKGVPQGLGNKFVGGVQTIATAVAPESDFSKRLAFEVGKLKQRQSQLSGSERAGIVGGEIGGDIMLSPTKGLGPVGMGAASGLASGLTTPLEDSSREARGAKGLQDTVLGGAFGKGSQVLVEGGSTLKNSAVEGVKNLVRGARARTPEELQAVGQGLKQKAQDLYAVVDNIGAEIKPSAAKLIGKKIANSLTESGPLFKANHGATISVVSDIQNDIANKVRQGNKIGLQDLDQYSQALKDVVRNNTDLAGKLNSDGYKALQAVNKIDDIFSKLPDKYLVNPSDAKAIALKNEATKQYGVYRRFEKVANIVEKSAGDPNRIKALTKNFISNRKNLQGFSKQEIQALKDAGNQSTGEGIAKMFGKFGLDLGTSQTAGNTALPIFGALASGASQGIVGGGATLATGTAARQAQKYLARGKLDQALSLIQSHKNPIEVISKIPNRKFQEKLINQLLIRAGSSSVGEANAQEPTEDDLMAQQNQERQKYPGIFAHTTPEQQRNALKQRYFRKK